MIDLVPMDVAGRMLRLRAALEELGTADALMVTKLVNVRYLTGFTGSAGLVLVLPDEVVLVTDGRYGQQAAEQLAAAGVSARIEVAGVEQREVVGAAVRAAGVTRLALEADAVTWAQQRAYAETWFAGHRAGGHPGPGRRPAAGQGRGRGVPHRRGRGGGRPGAGQRPRLAWPTG